MIPTAQQHPLREVAQVSAGHAVRGAIDGLPRGDVAMIQIRDISADAGIDWSATLRVSPPGKQSPDYLQPGDIVFTTRGARNVAAVVDPAPRRAICAPNLFVIRITRRDLCLPAYLAWYINQRPAQSYLQSQATGTNILNIRREVVEQLPLPLPDRPKQIAIIAFSAAAHAERQRLQALIENRDQQLDALALELAAGMETEL